jgi:hypothetical protein
MVANGVDIMIGPYSTDEMTVALLTASGSRGEKTFGEAVPTVGRFQFKSFLFSNSQGDQEQGDAIAYLELAVPVRLEAKLSYDETDYRVVLHSSHRDLDGDGLHKVGLQRIP